LMPALAVCGLPPPPYEPTKLPWFTDDPGRADPATENPPPPCESEAPCLGWKACSAPAGRENARPSCKVMIRIPGLRGFAGGVALASEAAVVGLSATCVFFLLSALQGIPMPFGSSEGTEGAEARGLVGFSFMIVEVEDERLNVLASGARWVSFSSEKRSVSRPTINRDLPTLCQFPGHDE